MPKTSKESLVKAIIKNKAAIVRSKKQEMREKYKLILMLNFKEKGGESCCRFIT